MKKLIKITLSTLFVLIMSMGISNAQSSHRVNHDLSFEDQSGVEQISIEVKSGMEIFSISASCTVKYGDVSVEIYDPKGVKQKHFSIGSEVRPKAPEKTAKIKSDEKKKLEMEKILQEEIAYAGAREAYRLLPGSFYEERFSKGGVQGRVDNFVKNPTAGKWLVKINLKNATARVNIGASQKK